MSRGYDFLGTLEVRGRNYSIEVRNDEIIDIKPLNSGQGQSQAPNGQAPGGQAPGQSGEPAGGQPPDDLPLDDTFKQRLNSILNDNKFLRHLPKRKRGKLDNRSLWRAPAGATNLFTQKQARKGRHYNVVLVVDKSSSMANGRIKLAAETASFLGRHFEALDIGLSVISFNDQAELLLPLGQKMDADLSNELVRSCAGGTNLYEGLKMAVGQLKNQPGQSLIIVISDGETDQANDCKNILRAHPQYRAFGVGIGSRCTVVPDNRLVDSAEELKPVILDWLGRAIRRGA